MKKVYVINKGCHDISDAKAYGELVYLSEGSINKFNTSTMYRRFLEELNSSSPNDHILVSGLTVMCCVACSIFATLHGRVNLLLYKSSRKKQIPGYYVSREIVIKDSEEVQL
jgi:hypothetical protein